ncbi:MAG: hypothetical protein EA424_20830 [Planctomycetaceae bacterium]|nr:MAG: hypothetical protein EA424_20830 [Planctomycetaceae bacterium]
MQRLVIFTWLLFVTTPLVQAANPCTNGSFERLGPGGFPVDWSPVGSQVEVVSEARTGSHAIRLTRTAETPEQETGLNRAGRPGTGEGGAMLEMRRGGLEFWYQAVSAESADLCVYAIPMNADGIEGTGSPRARFTVPGTHIGDGQWHRGRLTFDFTDNPDVRWVQVASRIVGTAGELILDDFAYVDRVGVILQVGAIQIQEDGDRAGQLAVVRARIENVGDADAQAVRVALESSASLTVQPAERLLDVLPAGRAERVSWTLDGARHEPSVLHVQAGNDDDQASGTLSLGTELQIRSFGPVQPVAAVDRPIALECVLENTGQTIVSDMTCEFTLGDESRTQTLAALEPGRSAVVRVEFQPEQQSTGQPAAVRVQAPAIDEALAAESQLVIGSALNLPPDRHRLVVTSDDSHAVLANRFLRLAFRRNQFGFGPGELSVFRGNAWQTVAWLPRLSRLVTQDASGDPQEKTLLVDGPPEVLGTDPARLGFRWQHQDDDGATWTATITFELEEWSREIRASYELGCDRPAGLLAFEGPMLYVLRRNEAIFPGLEWLVDEELSSDSLDIAEDHPHRIRYVVHPNMVTVPAVGFQTPGGAVGMYWDQRQRWDARRDRPSVVFASPDRFENQRAHLVGLFVPSVPEFVEINQRTAARPYPMRPRSPLSLQATLFADSATDSALASIDRWMDRHALPELRSLPRGTYQREIEFSVQAYLTSLWDPATQQWWLTKGNPVLSTRGRPRTFIADLMLGALITEDPALRRRLTARAEEVRALLGGEPRLDAQRFPDRADLAFANPASASQLLMMRDEDGFWRFDADQQPQTGPFVGMDYSELGPDGALESGTIARNAYQVLRYARIAGDRHAYQQVVPALQRLRQFRVPRAAQVWEIPVHAPDLLAAADSVDAFLEAYRISDEPRWLQAAVTWAQRGLPFVYLWDDPDQPFLQGASIPVFGATWHRGSWFGRPVQWNGLRYAVALIKLSQYDDSYPWRDIAERLIRSAIYQQQPDGENVALWPDYIDAIDGERCEWVFAPQQIIEAVLKLTGRNPQPTTVKVGEDSRIAVSTVGTIHRATHRGTVLSMEVEYPPGEQGIVLIANVSRPTEVYIDESALRERIDIEQRDDPGWRYDAGNAYLTVRVNKDGRSRVRADGLYYRSVRRLPWLVEEIAFEFDDSLDGWLPGNDISEMLPLEGGLFGRISGPDPYLVRPLVQIQGDDVAVVNLRMRVTAGSTGQLFWTTETSPEFDEEKSIRFRIIPDGRYHEYRVLMQQHPAWKGQTITQLRLDPCAGARSGEFQIDYLRADKPSPIGTP